MDSALIVFAKPPVPGSVKTRLASMLSEEEAARLYGAFVRDTLLQYATLGVHVRLYWAGDTAMLPSWLDVGSASVHSQKGRGLGARIRTAFAESFDAGYKRLVIAGTDSPTLPIDYVRDAFTALKMSRSVVLGPCEDGGFYLLGMRSMHEILFRGMRYSQPDVFMQTFARAVSIAARITVLPSWYDVDTPDTLKRLFLDVAKERQRVLHTADVLENLSSRYPEFFSANHRRA